MDKYNECKNNVSSEFDEEFLELEKLEYVWETNA